MKIQTFINLTFSLPFLYCEGLMMHFFGRGDIINILLICEFITAS